MRTLVTIVSIGALGAMTAACVSPQRVQAPPSAQAPPPQAPSPNMHPGRQACDTPPFTREKEDVALCTERPS